MRYQKFAIGRERKEVHIEKGRNVYHPELIKFEVALARHEAQIAEIKHRI